MKKIYAIVVCLLIGGSTWGQTDVFLNIKHMLGTAPFQFNTAAVNSMGDDFDVRRLEYYLSQMTLIHDGGQETEVPGYYLLVDGGVPTNELLGNFAITDLEGIRFGVGVDSAVNHLDPSSYSAGNPLAPQNPSMHWGWSAGYRFVAMEGQGGTSLSQNFEVHALEDRNYFETTINTTGFVSGNGLTVALVGDYIRALDSVSVAAGFITHGGNGEAVSVLANFRDHVFTPATVFASQSEPVEVLQPQIWPNPVAAGSSVSWRFAAEGPADVAIMDLNGRTLWEGNADLGSAPLAGFSPGIYLLKVSDQQGRMGVSQLVIQ